MNVIIDGGLHTFDANVSFLEGSLDSLLPGGFYIVEDIVYKWKSAWIDRIENVYASKYPACQFAFVELPNERNFLRDNNLLIVHRSA
jgi:hypothetical protein